MGDDPTISVLVATYRSPESLARVVRAVLAQLHATDELIVVDDGSGDDTPHVLSSFGDQRLTTIVQDNAGVSAARNRAASGARGDLLVFLDDDEVPEEGWLAAHRRAHGSAPSVIMGRAELIVRAGRRTQRIPARTLPTGGGPDVLVNDSFSVPRASFEAVGGFDERLVHGGEDVDLGLRLVAAGLTLRVAADAVICHEIERTYREFRAQRLRRGRASLLLEERHGVGLVAMPDALPRRDRPWAWAAMRSRALAELLSVLLWSVVRVAGVLSLWPVQAAAASRITLMLSLVGRRAAARTGSAGH